MEEIEAELAAVPVEAAIAQRAGLPALTGEPPRGRLARPRKNQESPGARNDENIEAEFATIDGEVG